MLRSRVLLSLSLWLCCLTAPAAAQNPNAVSWEGEAGPGKGKHIVFVASDHEYRSEEACPALARILARHHGFKCTVIFGTDPATGFLQPGSSNVKGLEVLGSADLLVLGLRFQNWADEEMEHFVKYVDSGKPIVALRTSTHSFQIPRDRKFARYDYRFAGADFEKGFGRQVLGETWVTHYGPNHTTSGKLLIEDLQTAHPVLRGVRDVWLESGVYTANPLPEGTTVLAKSQVLRGMSADSPPDTQLTVSQPAVWVRSLPTASSGTRRIFTTTHGCSSDLLNDGFRRLVVNGCLWSLGMESVITPDLNIAFVGPYQPSTFAFDGYKLKVKPADLAGWDSPILGGEAPPPRPNRGNRRGAAAGN